MSSDQVEQQASINVGIPGPQVGEEYTDGTKVVTVTAVGETNALAVDEAGTEMSYPILAAEDGGAMSPVVPVAIVPVNTILYEYSTGAERGLWTNGTVASFTGRRILLRPNGTWSEET